MAKRIIIFLVCLLLLVGILAGIKTQQVRKMIAAGKQVHQPPAIVTTAKVGREIWQKKLTTVGSLSAVKGVTVAAELSGKVVKIDFTSGKAVQKGELLLRLDTSTEEAQLRAARANVTLAAINRKRAGELVKKNSMSRAKLDSADALYQEAVAKVDEIRAVIEKKTIRAPFSGRLGIRLVNTGQVLAEGDAIVALQRLNPIFVDFSLPQQDLSSLEPGLVVETRTDVLPQKVIVGKITAINPGVDPQNRNIKVRATLNNPAEKLRPGMFVKVTVLLPEKNSVLVIPATSILYAPFGDSVFVVEKKSEISSAKSGLVLRQQVVRTGRTRGDFIAITSGLKEGDTVVTTGVFKFRNGQPALVDNRLSPKFSKQPVLKNE